MRRIEYAEETHRERIALLSPPHLQGVQTLIVDNSEPRIWRAYHETFTTCVIFGSESGPAEWAYRGKTQIAAAGGTQFMEPGETHTNNQQVVGASFRVLLISPAVMKKAITELGGRADGIHFKIAQTFDPTFFAAFRDLHISIENDAPVLEQQSCFAVCLQLLARKCVESPLCHLPEVHSSSVRKVKAHLCDFFSRNVSLEELSQISGVSRFHLLRSFRREVGMPPHAYQIQLRLSVARQLLRSGWSVADTAAHAGFSDQSHFTRLFKRFWGITPKVYSDTTRPRSFGLRGQPSRNSKIRSSGKEDEQ